MSLKDFVIQYARQTPDAVAVKGPDGSMTYSELDRLANRYARVLEELGVSKGDRVGIWLDKSAQVVAVMQGVLRLGAAYVPLDPLSPASRLLTILQDCNMRALVSSFKRIETTLADSVGDVATVCIDGPGPEADWNDIQNASDEPFVGPHIGDHDLAYILYTSGSTGTPKGVCISDRNALAFIEWAGDELKISAKDLLSNHAPFHFDLSVLDLYAAFRAGASVTLIPDGMAYAPKRLVDFIQQEKITIWYSVPSILIMMMEQGGLLEQPSLPMRVVLFAGEPFPIKHLKRLFARWPSLTYLNLYGPTETNVCTFYEVTSIQNGQTKPVPIGRECSGDKVWAVKDDGSEVQPGEEGELMVSGPTVMLGYWGLPPHGDKPYRTGDLVRLQEDGNFTYIGRRDHMVKVRGHRVELGDIEAALVEHPEIHETAVVLAGSGIEARLVAFVVSTTGESLPLLNIKQHCAKHLPRYMIIDDVSFLSALPRTRNGKIDRIMLTPEVGPKIN